MEPFFLRCETCRARLRVRDERFLGQVQSCPKCGSMVQILAPAGWLTSGEATPAPDTAEVTAVNSPTLSTSIVDTLRPHAVLWSTGAAAAAMACGLVAFFALRGGEEVAALPTATPVVEVKAAEPHEEVKQELPSITEVELEVQTVISTPPVPLEPPRVEQVEVEAAVAEVKPPVVAPPQTIAAPVMKKEQPRTLMLEPVQDDVSTPTVNATVLDTPNYPPAIEAEVGTAVVKPQAARQPGRVTNVKDQLAVPIESIDLPAMPIGEFVNLLSGMAAVPIELDAKVLGEVGLSTRSIVTVRADDTTVGKLLARVLKEHQLTCVERDGVLVVVKAKR